MLELPHWAIYCIYTGVLALILPVITPREKVRQLLIYGIIFGAAMDFLWIIFLSLFTVVKYINYGPFGFLGIPFFPPIAWTIYFIMYFYFLPEKKFWAYFYTFIAIICSIIFANVLGHFEILKWEKNNAIWSLFIYGLWHLWATWGYRRLKKSRIAPD